MFVTIVWKSFKGIGSACNVYLKYILFPNFQELATRARAGKLQLHEFQGGSFT